MGFFISRYRQLAAQYPVTDVLDCLPLCLVGDALDWHDSLPTEVKMRMNTDLDLWDALLAKEFRQNTGEAMAQAKRLRFRFVDSGVLSLKTYLRRKKRILQDAGILDEATLIYQTWEGLDDLLKQQLAIRNNETFESFTERAREMEPAAFSAYQRAQRTEKRGTGYQYPPRQRWDSNGAQNSTGSGRYRGETGNGYGRNTADAKPFIKAETAQATQPGVKADTGRASGDGAARAGNDQSRGGNRGYVDRTRDRNYGDRNYNSRGYTSQGGSR